MAIPTYIGSVSATLIEEIPTVDFEGFDSLVQVWEMKQSDVPAFVTARQMNQTPTESFSIASVGGMYLKQVSPRGGGSPFSQVTLTYKGFINIRTTSGGNYVDRADSISQMASTVSTTTDESVSVTYFGQRTTYRWFSSSRPNQPRFPLAVPSEVPTQIIFDASPANYTGTLQIKYVSRLESFDRLELAPNKWAVVESWMRRIEDAS